MSLQTWKKEYYKIPAYKVSEEDAIEHSLNKWRGLREENLKKHNVYISEFLEVIDDEELGDEILIDSDSCALCQIYYDHNPIVDEEHCTECSLYKTRNNTACDRWDGDVDTGTTKSPYKEFTSNKNPEKMIFWLEKAKEFVSKNGR